MNVTTQNNLNNHINVLFHLVRNSNGIILTRDVTNIGIPRAYISKLVKKKILFRVYPGVYTTMAGLDDKMSWLQKKYSAMIFSHESALRLLGLSDREPLKISVTLPFGYNPGNIKKLGIIVHTVKKETYLLGKISRQDMFGNTITLYNAERTICDIIKNRKHMDDAILNDAIRRYFRRKDRNIPQLLRYAKALRILGPVKKYVGLPPQG